MGGGRGMDGKGRGWEGVGEWMGRVGMVERG